MLWGLVALVILLALVGVTRLLRRLVLVFALAAAGLLLLHMQTAPGEAVAGLGVLVGGLTLSRIARRMVTGFVV
ncbi:hypothetical protein [Marimonas arenosa]|uniref:Uncharacterized protein n=1 Tax=Marimonas arenosa TaxID=1795305 RepID=A0AAE3WGW8_9RHOB|nr:hypothetical protein [Marimonas arenosa]MDQ2091577.1 hypothetical protein [Marimonas arenosa]